MGGRCFACKAQFRPSKFKDTLRGQMSCVQNPGPLFKAYGHSKTAILFIKQELFHKE